MNSEKSLERFVELLNNIQDVLTPRILKDTSGKVTGKVTKPSFVKSFVTIVGLKTTTSRFLPVSHEGYSTETFIDKVDLLGYQRAEFIARKIKGIERRAHMSMFRELLVQENGNKKAFEEIHKELFGRECYIPSPLCIACWNCSLFGGLEAGKGGTFSRIRYFDTFSIENAELCVAMEGSEEGMAIGNTVLEDLKEERGPESYHQYEYVKAGSRFPIITIIENPTLLDIAGYLKTVEIADRHGYGKYSANHGKFRTNFFAVATGFPKFSILDMLDWKVDEFENKIREYGFESNSNNQTTLYGSEEISALKDKLNEEFKKYYKSLQ